MFHPSDNIYCFLVSDLLCFMCQRGSMYYAYIYMHANGLPQRTFFGITLKIAVYMQNLVSMRYAGIIAFVPTGPSWSITSLQK